MLEIPRVCLRLNQFARLASSELVEGILNLIEGFETTSIDFIIIRPVPDQGAGEPKRFETGASPPTLICHGR